MVAAGVPSPRPDHARALALMALDMQAAMRTVDDVGHLGLELRVGINSGPVVAGVIGRKRFLYDLWGDAVNTASRMESHGTSGRIQITLATKELLGDEFVCESRGTIPVKGKGEIEVWYLVGRRLSSLVAAEDRQQEEEHVEGAEEDRGGEQRRRSDVLGAAQPLEVEEG
jgi:adenylate cyclase